MRRCLFAPSLLGKAKRTAASEASWRPKAVAARKRSLNHVYRAMLHDIMIPMLIERGDVRIMLDSSIGELLYANTPIVIILIFTLIPLLIGSMASQNSISTIQDFFICGRSMGTTISFFTVYATWWSSFAFLGSISYFYSIGSVYWTAIAWNVLFGVLYMWFGLRISSYGKEKGYITPIHFFSDIYDSHLLNILVTSTMILFTIPYIQIQFYGGAILIESATKGVISWQLCAFSSTSRFASRSRAHRCMRLCSLRRRSPSAMQIKQE